MIFITRWGRTLATIALCITWLACLVRETRRTTAQIPSAANNDSQSHKSDELRSFDVVSVKRLQQATLEDSRTQEDTIDGYIAKGVTLRTLLQEAFGISDEDREIGMPGWSDTVHFDVFAKVEDEHLEAYRKLHHAQIMVMLQNLLVDRFGLRSHIEAKDQPIYALVVGKNGPKLKESEPLSGGGPGSIHIISGAPHLIIERCTMDFLAKTLSRRAGRSIVDETGLSGRYDVTLDLSLPPDATDGSQEGILPAAPTGSSIFSAIQEQLGLKLESKRGPVDSLVIDHIQMPTEN